ncbi:MAG: signal peptidase I [Gammaproteobacteria bacterium]|nr:signal peptidase I [Gammaproteobacteria bacterium]MDH5652607.1 signal peptidase I [Gammaproteobacteria bacterium]
MFSLFLFILVVVSGVIWAVDHFLYEKKRIETAKLNNRAPVEPVAVEYARFLFPVVLIVFVLRGFIAEPFRIPSGSMLPTLEIGDFILVSKFSYGVRLPVINKKIVELGTPQRGDVIVFRYPEDPSVDYIKRVIGVPGDKIAYDDKTVYINGKPQQQKIIGEYFVENHGMHSRRGEDLGTIQHDILINQRGRVENGVWVVPPGHYFVLGDNRDNSRDSRYWNFVPDENLVGKAFFIWMHWNGGPGFGRIGTVIK